MANRKKGATPQTGDAPRLNDFSADQVAEFFDRLDEINERKKTDVASANSDMNGVYDSMAEALGIEKEAAVFLWNRHNAEQRFQKRAKKMDAKQIKSLERFAKACDGTPLGDWAGEAAKLASETNTSSTRSTTQSAAPKTAAGEKTDAEADAETETAGA